MKQEIINKAYVMLTKLCEDASAQFIELANREGVNHKSAQQLKIKANELEIEAKKNRRIYPHLFENKKPIDQPSE